MSDATAPARKVVEYNVSADGSTFTFCMADGSTVVKNFGTPLASRQHDANIHVLLSLACAVLTLSEKVEALETALLAKA